MRLGLVAAFLALAVSSVAGAESPVTANAVSSRASRERTSTGNSSRSMATRERSQSSIQSHPSRVVQQTLDRAHNALHH